MIVKVSKFFEKDLARIRDRKLEQAVFDIIRIVQQVPDLRGIPQLKKLKGHKQFYQIRLGNYRAGIAITNWSYALNKFDSDCFVNLRDLVSLWFNFRVFIEPQRL